VLYGTTESGGLSNKGVLFSFNAKSATYTKVEDPRTRDPAISLEHTVLAADGKRYGIIDGRESNSKGNIVYFDFATLTYTKVFDFEDTDAANPNSLLLKASDNRLYGTTAGGGANGLGVLFSFDPTTATYTKVLDFNNTNAADFRYSLIEVSSNKIYGITHLGGNYGFGLIFSIDVTTSTYTKVYDFDSTHRGPRGNLVLASDGKLYGMTDNLGHDEGPRYAYIFSFNPTTDTYTNLYKIDGENGEGVNLVGSMVQALDGKLYGVTRSGGVLDMGTLFSFDPLTNAYERVNDFKGPDGEEPSGGLMLASDGKLYGVTRYGGNGFVSLGEGVIYSYDPAETTFRELWIFGGEPDNNDENDDEDNQDGIYPSGMLVEYTPVEICNGQDDDGDGQVDEGCMPVTITCPGNATLTADAGSCTAVVKSLPPVNVGGANTTTFGFELSGATEGGATGEIADEVFNVGVTKVTYFASDGEGGQASCSFTVTVKAGAEICGNGKDDDCDGVVDEGCTPVTTWYRDADGDGFGNPASSKVADKQPRGYVSNADDCNDKNKVKGGPEVCDGIDNDCDGIIDDGLTEFTFYSDFDGDGYGSPKRLITTCAAPPRFVSNSEDQNDDNKNVYPGAPELCDGRDNNQNGSIDEGFARTTFYHDFDEDGYGRSEVTLQACAAPLNYVTVGGDCNDRNGAIHPGAAGPPNDGVDNNCNGLIDEPLRSTARSKGGEVVGEQQLSLQLTATPNPSQHYFTLRIQSQSNKPVQLRIVDDIGRVVEARQGIAANNTLTVGHSYRTGVYIAEVRQEGKKAIVKLVKQQ
jgi:uncharacterized repeat protein (TIGR03803 family)